MNRFPAPIRTNLLICFCFSILAAAQVQASDLCKLLIEQLGLDVGQSLTIYGPKSRRPKVIYAVGDQLVFRAHSKTIEVVTKDDSVRFTVPNVVRALSVLPFGEIEEGKKIRPHIFSVEHTGGFSIYRFNGTKHRVLDSTNVGKNVQLGFETFTASPLESVLTPVILMSTDDNLNLRSLSLDFRFVRSSLRYVDNTMMDGPIHSIAMVAGTKGAEVVEGPNSFIVVVVDAYSISAFDLDDNQLTILSSQPLKPPTHKRILVAGKIFVDGENEPHTAFHVFSGMQLQTFALVGNVLRMVASRQLSGRVESAAVGTAPGELHYLMRDAAGQLHRVRMHVSGSLVLEEQVFSVLDLLPPGSN